MSKLTITQQLICVGGRFACLTKRSFLPVI